MIIQSTQKNKRTVQGEGGLSPSTGIEVTPVSVRACALESFGLLLALRSQSKARPAYPLTQRSACPERHMGEGRRTKSLQGPEAALTGAMPSS